MVGVGVVVRDDQGKVILAQGKSILAMYDPATGEAVAALVAVELYRDLDVFDVILEGDSLEVVNAINEDRSSRRKYGHILDDIKMVLSSLRSWEVMHVKREANMVAHNLAKEASKLQTDRTWIEDCPLCILDIVNLEHLALAL
jgi:ribonuclease HI